MGSGVGAIVGVGVGAIVGSGVGAIVGDGVGAIVGSGVGAIVENGVGAVIGVGVGAIVGDGVGADADTESASGVSDGSWDCRDSCSEEADIRVSPDISDEGLPVLPEPIVQTDARSTTKAAAAAMIITGVFFFFWAYPHFMHTFEFLPMGCPQWVQKYCFSFFILIRPLCLFGWR